MPDVERARAALARAELVVCQDAYDPTETTALAHVVLPAAQWPEKQGTMTNSERRVTLVRQAIDPPADARPDWQIFAGLGRAFGFGEHFAWRTAAEVYDEFAALTAGRPCDMAGISHARLDRRERCSGPARRPGTPAPSACTWTAGFTPVGPSAGRGHRAGRLPERTDGGYPLVLTTGRVASQWHTMTRTGKSRQLMAAEPEPFLECNPADAARAGVAEGELARVCSRRGSAILRVRYDKSLPGAPSSRPSTGARSMHPPARAR